MQEKRVDSIRQVDMSELIAPVIAVHQHPTDFPDKCVARIFDMDRPTDTIIVKETVAEIVQDIQENTSFTYVPRGAADVPSLVSVWI